MMNNINYINMNQMNPSSFSYQNNTSTKLMGFARLKKKNMKFVDKMKI